MIIFNYMVLVLVTLSASFAAASEPENPEVVGDSFSVCLNSQATDSDAYRCLVSSLLTEVVDTSSAQ